MKNAFNIILEPEDREKIRSDMRLYGITTEASYLRMLIKKHPAGPGWTDKDMISFARSFVHRDTLPSGVLESEDRQLQKALEKFKQSK
jgi:hypothetical protein